MANIGKRTGAKGTTYRVLIRRKGFPAESATFRRLSDARAWATKIEGAMEEGRYFPERISRSKTLKDLALRYTNREPREEGKVGGNSTFLGLTMKEQAKRIMHLDWWTDALGNPTLDRLTPGLISEGREKLAEGGGPSGRPLTLATQKRYSATMSTACTFGCNQGWLRENPVKRLDPITEPKGRVRFLSDDERDALIAECEKSDEPRLLAMVVFSISTAARQNEMLMLPWQDVDLEKGTATFTETKNGETRTVPVTGFALELLKDRSKVRRIDKAVDFVFADAKGKPTFPRRAFLKALKAAEIDDFRWHDLRHTCASYLAQNGASLAVISEVLGHKTLAMVKRYTHLTEQHTAPVVADMTAKVFGGAS